MNKATSLKQGSGAGSGKVRRTHRERVDLSDRLMLEAAAQLILSQGTAQTTLKAVGEQAGYSRGLAHARFGSKEVLFLKLADRCRRTWIDEMRRMQGETLGLTALVSRIDAIASYVKRHPDEARVMYILWFESVGSVSDMREGLRKFHDQAREDIQSLFEEAVAAGEIAEVIKPFEFAVQFCASFFGLCYQWLINPDSVNVEAQIEGFKRQTLMVLQSEYAD